MVRLKVRLVQEADVDAMLTEESDQFQLSAANTVSLAISQPEGTFPSFPGWEERVVEKDCGSTQCRSG
jgi:hypothetical protein